jgi:hypothetical protein
MTVKGAFYRETVEGRGNERVGEGICLRNIVCLYGKVIQNPFQTTARNIKGAGEREDMKSNRG